MNIFFFPFIVMDSLYLEGIYVLHTFKFKIISSAGPYAHPFTTIAR